MRQDRTDYNGSDSIFRHPDLAVAVKAVAAATLHTCFEVLLVLQILNI